MSAANDTTQVLRDELDAAGNAFQEEAQNTAQTTDDQSGDVQTNTYTVTRAPAASDVSSTQDPNTQQQMPQTQYPPNIGPRRLGIVTSYHARKGWGFIRDMYTSEVFFAHHTEVVPYWPDDRIGSDSVRNFKNCLHMGEYVEFCVGENQSTGDVCAKHVTGLCGYTLQMDWATIRYIQTRNARTGEISSVSRPQRRDDRSSFSRSDQTREYGSTTIQQRQHTQRSDQPLQQRRRTQQRTEQCTQTSASASTWGRTASSTTQTSTVEPTGTQSTGHDTSTVPSGW